MKTHTRRLRKIKQTKNTEPKKSIFHINSKRIWGLLSRIVLILGLYQLWPSVSLTVDTPLKNTEPYSTPFLIKNESLYKIKIISVTIFTRNIKAKTKTIENLNINNSSTTIYILKYLEPKKSIHFFSNLIRGIPLTYISNASITVSILYKPIFTNITFHDDFDYTFYITDKNTLKWYPY